MESIQWIMYYGPKILSIFFVRKYVHMHLRTNRHKCMNTFRFQNRPIFFGSHPFFHQSRSDRCQRANIHLQYHSNPMHTFI